MTNKEAVEIIKECKEKGFKHTFYTLNEYHTALDMAIKALEQEPCEEAQRRDGMIDIRFYIPKDESIPTDLRLYVGENYVEYERTANGFLFKTLIDDEDEAMKVVQQIVNKMELEHDESEYGVSWCTISLAVVPQEERYQIGTWVEWKYRVRDSY